MGCGPSALGTSNGKGGFQKFKDPSLVQHARRLGELAVPSKNFHEKYDWGAKIGEGSFGQVRTARKLGEYRETELAVKIMDLRQVNSDGQPMNQLDKLKVHDARVEEHTWRLVGEDKHCVQLIETFFDNKIYYMVMEKCRCSMLDALAHLLKYSDASISDVMRQMLLGIRHMHSVGVVHRDIKPDNFLFGGPNGNRVKLCDFGLATALPKTSKVFGQFGTAPYMSPEMLNSVGYREETDVWSYGTTVYILFYGKFPYCAPSADGALVKHAIRTGIPEPCFTRLPQHPDDPSPNASAFARSLLKRSSDERPSATQALLHPFFSSAHRTDSKESAPAVEAVKQAKKANAEFRAPRNHVLQKSIDEVMADLQAAKQLGTSFSEKDDASKDSSPLSKRSPSRMATHSGAFGFLSSETMSESTEAPRDSSTHAASEQTSPAQTMQAVTATMESLPTLVSAYIKTQTSLPSYKDWEKDEVVETNEEENNTNPFLTDPAWAPELWCVDYKSEVTANCIPMKDFSSPTPRACNRL